MKTKIIIEERVQNYCLNTQHNVKYMRDYKHFITNKQK